MPTLFGMYLYRRRPATCRKKVRWSQMRGGCRFAPGHTGECRPGSGRRGYVPLGIR